MDSGEDVVLHTYLFRARRKLYAENPFGVWQRSWGGREIAMRADNVV